MLPGSKPPRRIRVGVSESEYPSRSNRVGVTESEYPSRSIRFGVSESAYPIRSIRVGVSVSVYLSQCIRVGVSESACPSRRVRVGVSDTTYPSRRIRVCESATVPGPPRGWRRAENPSLLMARGARCECLDTLQVLGRGCPGLLVAGRCADAGRPGRTGRAGLQTAACVFAVFGPPCLTGRV